MSAKTTPDERFLIKLYELASAKGDPYSAVKIADVARGIGLKETATKNIVKALAQANFLKKGDNDTVYLTERGARFVQIK